MKLQPRFSPSARAVIFAFAQLFAAVTFAQSVSAPAAPDVGPDPRPESWQPNVLVILCDQLNVRMLGHEDNGYGGVSTSLTPNLDSLAAGGVRFSNATCPSAVCQASRVSIFTGRWPFNHGVRVNGVWEPRTETLFPELAREAGYETANVGLHHLMWDNQPQGWGDDHGFNKIIDLGDYGQYCGTNGIPPYNAPANVWTMPGLPVYGEIEHTGYTLNENRYHPSSYFADEVIRFLRERAGPQGDGKPFVCWYSMISPHTPILPSGVSPDDWAHMYHPFNQLSLPPNFDKTATTGRLAYSQSQFSQVTGDEMKEALSYYYGLISQFDHNVGRVFDAMDDLGLTDDTLVVFTTDHGEMSAEMSCWTKGAGSYDALTRVPLIMRLPGVLPAGRVVEEPALTLDIFPTLAEVTGVPITDEVREGLDGESLAELMIEPSAPANWRQEAFHVLGTENSYGGHHFAVRTPTAKYTVDELDGAEEFYDLANDPWELNDRFLDVDAGIQAQIADLQGRLQSWWNGGQGHAPHYGLMGAWGAKPIHARIPWPEHKAVDVVRDPNPSWVPCTGALYQEVYFGTDPTNLPLFTSIEHMGTEFNPGTLDASTTYFWRVDQVNANGTTAGQVWRFRTEDGGQGGPDLSHSPSPAHLSTGATLGVQLSWSPGSDTTSQDFWFGEADAMQLVAQGMPSQFNAYFPENLQAGVTYEWRVDGTNADGTTEGDVWRFTVSELGLPHRAEVVHPAHFGANVPANTVLKWDHAACATSYDVYFGTDHPLAFQGNQAGTTFDPGTLSTNETYYWRIDSVNLVGTTRGWTWRFTH